MENLFTWSQRTVIEKLNNYDMSFVFERLKIEGELELDSQFELEREFKNFFALVGCEIFPLAMIGPKIDKVWHQFILFTRQYREFCFETVGHFVNHQPDVPSNQIPTAAGQNFLDGYRRYFGRIPSLWFEGMDPETLAYFQQAILIGRPPTAWSGWVGPEQCLPMRHERRAPSSIS